MRLWQRATPDRRRGFSKHALPNKPGWPLAFSGRSEPRSAFRLSGALADPGVTRNAFETAAHSSAPCRCYCLVNMPCGIACIALHIQTSSKQAGLTAALLWSVWATLGRSLEQRSSWPKRRPKHAGLTAALLWSVWAMPGRSLEQRSSWPKRRPKHAGLTAALLGSVWATLWHSLEQRSSWPKLPPPAFKHAGLETCHAFVKTCHTGSPTLLLETCPSKQAGLTVGPFRSIWATLWLSLEQRSGWPRLQTNYSGHFFPPGRFHRGCVHCARAFSTQSLEQTNPPTDGTPGPDRPSFVVGCRVWIKTHRREGTVELWRAPGWRPGRSRIRAVNCWLGLQFGYCLSAHALETCPAVVKPCHTGSPTLLLDTCPFQTSRVDSWPSLVDRSNTLTLAWATLWLQNMPGWPLAFSGRSEHRSDTRLSNALAD